MNGTAERSRAKDNPRTGRVLQGSGTSAKPFSP